MQKNVPSRTLDFRAVDYACVTAVLHGKCGYTTGHTYVRNMKNILTYNSIV